MHHLPDILHDVDLVRLPISFTNNSSRLSARHRDVDLEAAFGLGHFASGLGLALGCLIGTSSMVF